MGPALARKSESIRMEIAGELCRAGSDGDLVKGSNGKVEWFRIWLIQEDA